MFYVNTLAVKTKQTWCRRSLLHVFTLKSKDLNICNRQIKKKVMLYLSRVAWEESVRENCQTFCNAHAQKQHYCLCDEFWYLRNNTVVMQCFLLVLIQY